MILGVEFSQFGAPIRNSDQPQTPPKSRKSDVKNRIVFCIDFFMVWAWFLRGFWEFFSRYFFFKASIASLLKSLRNLAHGDKIKGPRFFN